MLHICLRRTPTLGGTHLQCVSHAWMRRVAHVNESCRTYKLVTPHTYSRRIIFNVCPVHEWVESHIKTGHFARINESHCTPTLGETHLQCVVAHMKVFCRTFTLRIGCKRNSFQFVSRTGMFPITHVLHMMMHHVTHINESCHTPAAGDARLE